MLDYNYLTISYMFGRPGREEIYRFEVPKSELIRFAGKLPEDFVIKKCLEYYENETEETKKEMEYSYEVFGANDIYMLAAEDYSLLVEYFVEHVENDEDVYDKVYEYFKPYAVDEMNTKIHHGEY